jgi:hypothetical protein
MTVRLGLAILVASWCAAALPGCALFGRRDVQESPPERPPERYLILEKAEPQLKPPERPIEATLSSRETTSGTEQTEAVQLQLPAGQRLPEFAGPPQTLRPLDPQPVPEPLPRLIQPLAGRADPPIERIAESPPQKEEPLVSALHYLLCNQPQEAMKRLEAFDNYRQNLFYRLLPMVATLGEKTFDQLSAEEKDALEKQLQGLVIALREPAELVISKMCLCERIDGYGEYKPVRAGHVFKAGSPQGKWSDLVQIYVELRNITCTERDGAYFTSLNGVIQIRDAQGAELWQWNCRASQPPLQRDDQPRSDWYRRYDFWMPNMPPGKYVLTIEVTDELHQPHRVAEKSIEFEVGS